ncbi:hypothetical protein R1flu_022593 [Riccia fluitans]|uniref:Uncharacterized protein n=1 Tax=Riccia fluitans TaxID=41844 RepID=A0ABD1XSM8_9MARC
MIRVLGGRSDRGVPNYILTSKDQSKKSELRSTPLRIGSLARDAIDNPLPATMDGGPMVDRASSSNRSHTCSSEYPGPHNSTATHGGRR